MGNQGLKMDPSPNQKQISVELGKKNPPKKCLLKAWPSLGVKVIGIGEELKSTREVARHSNFGTQKAAHALVQANAQRLGQATKQELTRLSLQQKLDDNKSLAA